MALSGIVGLVLILAVLAFVFYGAAHVADPNYKLPKLGRNAPCHCGSGKKYKECCLAKDLELKDAADEQAEHDSLAYDRIQPEFWYPDIARRGETFWTRIVAFMRNKR